MLYNNRFTTACALFFIVAITVGKVYIMTGANAMCISGCKEASGCHIERDGNH